MSATRERERDAEERERRRMRPMRGPGDTSGPLTERLPCRWEASLEQRTRAPVSPPKGGSACPHPRKPWIRDLANWA